jgi:hypothetical protein
MRVRRLLVAAIAITIGSALLVGCSQQTRAVNDPKCIAFRKAASVYTNQVTRARYARRTAENAAIGKPADSPEVGGVKVATDAWLKAQTELQHFYAADKSGCVSR